MYKELDQSMEHILHCETRWLNYLLLVIINLISGVQLRLSVMQGRDFRK